MNREMKRLIIFICIVFYCGTTFGQSLKFDSNIFNFGKIEEKNGVVKHTFKLTNTSSKPFIINYTTTGCGCTVITYDKSPIMPKQTRNLEVAFDPKDRAGFFNTNINIIGASPKEDYRLSLIGNVIPRQKRVDEIFPIVLESGLRASDDKIGYGIIPTSEEHINTIELYNSSKNTISLEAKNLNTKFSTVRVYPQKIEPNQKASIIYSINLSAENYLGYIDDTIELKINNTKFKKPLIVSATVIPNFFDLDASKTKNAPIVHMPSVFHFFTSAKKGDILSKDFVITNRGKDDLIIEKVLIKDKEISYKLNSNIIKSGKSGTITIYLDTKKIKGEVSRRATLLFNAPQSPIKTVILSTKID